MKTSGGCIGIELTEYHVQEPDQGWGSLIVPTITPSDLQRIMRNKEVKMPSYRRCCREVWLLIVARGFEPSTFGDLSPEVEGYLFESGLDCVFFLHYFNGIVTELHVCSSGPDRLLTAQ